MDAREVIIALDVYYDHKWSTVYNVIKNKETQVVDDEVFMLHVDAQIFALIHDGYKFCYLMDDEYPEEIRNTVIKPPFVIYYKCKPEEIRDKFFAKKYECEKGCFLEE